jgi:hypothetical protein
MKKLRVLTTAIALVLTVNTFAATGEETSINPSVSKSFKKDFGTATNVKWQKKDEVYFASFELNNTKSEAAFNEAGEIIALSKIVSTAQLPLAIQVSIAEKYAGYELSKNATEIMYEGQTNYYINVSNNKETVKLKCAVNGEITIDNKVKN